MKLTSYKEYILEKVIYMILESKIVFSKNFLGILSKMEVMRSQKNS
jgi:hypothetical protein